MLPFIFAEDQDLNVSVDSMNSMDEVEIKARHLDLNLETRIYGVLNLPCPCTENLRKSSRFF